MNERRCRSLVYERSGGLCERCGRKGHTYHHRKNRSAGGKWDCANIVFLCGDGVRGCHGWVTTHPKEAAQEGFHVPRWSNPSKIPILLHRKKTVNLSWDTSAYDITQTELDDHPEPNRKTEHERTAPDHRSWNPHW